MASLHAERDSVREFLAAQQTRLERAEATLEDAIARLEAAVSDGAAEGGDKTGGGDEDDYRRRYEMALDDLRELKAGNSLLQEQLSKARATASTLAKENRSQAGRSRLGERRNSASSPRWNPTSTRTTRNSVPSD